nr:unnamed protein product [Spirometra erinaceieuropaei]
MGSPLGSFLANVFMGKVEMTSLQDTINDLSFYGRGLQCCLVYGKMNVCTFSFSRTYAPNVVVSCEDYVCIPRDQPLTWLLSRLILTHGIPKFAEADFSDALQVFIEEEENKFYDKSASKLYDEFIADDSNGERIAAELETAVDERTTSRRQLESLADEEIFGQAYARIVQSATAMDLVQLEHSFAVAVETEIIERKRALNDMQKMHVSQFTFLP